ncbi:hypothetical protein [Bradyrhizobium sp.]|uniref:hypothetical protein n=1 Tax=Bradyrhizobium sp. TaxID=376 RepID=UPI003C2856D6
MHHWLKLVAGALVLCVLGLPINDITGYVCLAAATMVFCIANINTSRRRLAAAAAVAIVACAIQLLAASPLIEEGHNVFVVDDAAPTSALERGLPRDVFRFMLAEFDRIYPPANRCDRNVAGCWRPQPMPAGAYAFSGDAVYDRPAFSRRVASIEIDDPRAWRTGFINERKYNWYDRVSDVERATFPWFTMFRFPSDYAGSSLCWRGIVLWEGDREQFTPIKHASVSCRTLEAADTGQRIFAVSIDPTERLSMRLEQTGALKLRNGIAGGARLLGVLLIVVLLAARPMMRDFILPCGLIAAALAVIAVTDPIFFGGIHIYAGGDDGLTHEGMGRTIVQALLHGDFAAALRSDEKVFYFVPGLRYLLALEKFIFGDTEFGYFTLLWTSPLLIFAVYRRFAGSGWALLAALLFVSSLGAAIGLSLRSFTLIAAAGYPDVAGTLAFLAGLLLVASKAREHWFRGLSGALLLGLAVWLRPNLLPPAAVVVLGAVAMSARLRDLPRAAALCAGFSVVGLMALHNWVFGQVFVPFGSNAAIPQVLVVPPLTYAQALAELAHFDLHGEAVARVVAHLYVALLGPSQKHASIIICAAEVAIVIRVALRRQSPQWDRLLAVAALAGFGIMLFYATTPRYHLLTWLLAAIVSATWLGDEALSWLGRTKLLQRWNKHFLVMEALKQWRWIERRALAPRPIPGR